MEQLLLPIVFLAVGGGFTFAGLYVWFSHRRIQKEGIRTKAKIIDFVQGDSLDTEDEYYFPIVRFKDRSGNEITQKLTMSENLKKINQPLDIIYLKKDGEYEILINNDFWKTYFPLAASIGVFTLINNI